MVSYEAKRALQNRDLMDYLYHVKGMSLNQIARLYGCGYETVRRGLIRLGIELRPQGENGQMLTPDLILSPELVHLIFALKGDGHVGFHNGCGHIRFDSIDKVLVDTIRDELFKVGLHPNVRETVTSRDGFNKNPKPFYKLAATSKLFAQYYLSLKPQDLLELGLPYPWDALRGLLETEGTMYYSKDNSLHVIVIYNTDLDLITVAHELLTTLGYKSSIYKNSNPVLHYRLNLLGTTSEKEEFLNKLNPCIKWPVENERRCT